MRPSTLLFVAGLAAAAPDANAVDDYLAIYEHATITNPSGGIVDFSGPLNITWAIPSNASSPTSSRFREVTKEALIWFQYHHDNITGYDGDSSVSMTTIKIADVTDFDPSTSFYEWEKPADAVKDAQKALERYARFMGLSDLPGGERWSVGISFSADNGTAESTNSEFFVVSQSSLFDIEGVDGYEAGQEGIEWGSSGVVLRPVGILAGVAAVAALIL